MRNKLPDFDRASLPAVKDAITVKLSVINARILMQELPLFGDHNGNVYLDAWKDDLWKQGLGLEGFAGMSPLAIASTHAFFSAMFGTAKCDSEAVQFIPQTNGSQFVKSREFEDNAPAIMMSSLDAIAKVYSRENVGECEEELDEKINASFDDFCEMLSVYLAKSDDSIPVVRAAIERVVRLPHKNS